MRGIFVLSMLVVVAAASCTSPRSVTHTGKVTPKGQLRLGGNFQGNIPSATSEALYDTIKDGVNEVERVIDGTDARWSREEGVEKLNTLMKALLIYSVDPLGMGVDLNVRYGLIDRVDVGYKYDTGAHAVDARLQFAGPTKGSRDFFGINLGPRWFGSIGVQVAYQDFKIPLPGLDKLQDLLKYSFKKYDLQVPLAFSYSFFSDDERYGAVSFGAVYNYSKVKWGIDHDMIEQLFSESLATMGLTVPSGDQGVHSYGAFVNLKLGYKYVYVVASLAVYYQNYGTFRLFDYSASYSGVTVVPTIGIVGQFFGM